MVVESIPIWSCQVCGESYFTAQTMHEIERIKALRKSIAKKRSVLVAESEVAAALRSCFARYGKGFVGVLFFCFWLVGSQHTTGMIVGYPRQVIDEYSPI
jgi:hypothetical protein